MSENIPLNESSKQRLHNLLNKPDPLNAPLSTLNPLISACQIIAGQIGVQMELDDYNLKSPDVESVAAAANLRVRKVSLNGLWWKYDNGPLLAFHQLDNKPLALLPDNNGGYWVIDPVNSNKSKLTAELACSLQITAYYFYKPFPDQVMTWKRIFHFISPYLGKYLGICLLLEMCIGLITLFTPYATGQLFSDIIPNSIRSELLQWVFILLIGVCLSALLAFSQGLILNKLRFVITVCLQSALWDRLLRLPLSLYRQFSVADLSMRSMTFDSLQQGLSNTFINGVLNIFLALFPFGIMCYYSLKLALGVLAIELVLFGLYAIILMQMLVHQRSFVERFMRMGTWIIQILLNLEKIRTTSSEERSYSRWTNDFLSSLNSLVRINNLQVKLSVLANVWGILNLMLIFYYGFNHQDKITFAMFVSFYTAYQLFANALVNVNTLLIQLSQISPLIDRVRPLIETVPETKHSGIIPGILSGRVVIRDISFSYNQERYLFENASLTIEPGQFIGLIGPSGCGKSTLARLLLGFDRPSSGHIYYDENDLQEINLQALRRQFGVVLQQDALLPGSILENICYGTSLNEEKAWEVAALVGLDKEIQALPMGMHTLIMDNAKTLSKGQRQRIMIARALVHQPRILLFDEASSSIDNLNQTLIHEHLKQLKLTRIVIAHRSTSMVGADAVYTIQDKKIILS